MRKVSIALLTVGLVFAAVPVLACSCHGSEAANQINNWLNGGAANNTVGGSDDSRDGGTFKSHVTVTGSQSNMNQGHGGNFIRDQYWVEITGPNGYTQKITATTNSGRTTVNVTDKNGNVLSAMTIDDGTELEMFLRDTAIAIIRTLLPDAAGSDYVG
jgi:hypothetical protein